MTNLLSRRELSKVLNISTVQMWLNYWKHTPSYLIQVESGCVYMQMTFTKYMGCPNEIYK